MTIERTPSTRQGRPRRNQPAYHQVANEIRNRIIAGDMIPGARLPAEAELSEMFGVSRSTVREALRVVASQSLVKTTRGVTGGTFVSTPEAGEMSDYLQTSLALMASAEDVDVAELLEARMILEAPAAALAAKRRTEEHLEQLRGSIEEGTGAEPGHGFEGNRSFHQVILEASGNRLLTVVTRPVFAVLRGRFLRDEAAPSFWNRVARDHRKILEAVEAGDSVTAEAEMRRHLLQLASTYRRIDRRDREQ